MTLSAQGTSISAVQARQRFGELLDKTFYQGKSFVVERAGKFMGVLVPISEYQEMQRIKNKARVRFFATTDMLRRRVADSGLTDKEVMTVIDEVVKEVRTEKPNPAHLKS